MGRGLSKNVNNLLGKAKESALLAVEIYNKPSISFRSGAYVTLMMVAWTSLFHAIFEKKRISYYYKRGRRYEYVDGEKKSWELKKCVCQYIPEQNDPIRKNLEFFIGLRNKIEHRFMPSIDSQIFGECQSLLINFEEILTKEFGQKHAISGNLVFALQFSKYNQQKNVIKQEAKVQVKRVLKYIQEFRQNIDEKLWQDERFSFRVLLIPKIGSNKNSSDIAVEFIKYDPTKPEEMEKYKHLVALVKEKEKIVQVANQGKYKPSDVVREVARRLGKRFTMGMHIKCYKRYTIRPARGATNAMECNITYCQYDIVHKDYVYTDKWIDFLVKELTDDNTYRQI